MATNSSIHAWRIPWTEEPVRLQSIGLQRVRHNEQLSTAQHSLELACVKAMSGFLGCAVVKSRPANA